MSFYSHFLRNQTGKQHSQRSKIIQHHCIKLTNSRTRWQTKLRQSIKMTPKFPNNAKLKEYKTQHTLQLQWTYKQKQKAEWMTKQLWSRTSRLEIKQNEMNWIRREFVWRLFEMGNWRKGYWWDKRDTHSQTLSFVSGSRDAVETERCWQRTSELAGQWTVFQWSGYIHTTWIDSSD